MTNTPSPSELAFSRILVAIALRKIKQARLAAQLASQPVSAPAQPEAAAAAER